MPPPKLRIRDKYLAYLRSHLESTRLKRLTLSDEGRIVFFFYENKHGPGIFALFWASRQLYFLNLHSTENGPKLFMSWESGEIDPLVSADEEKKVLDYLEDRFFTQKAKGQFTSDKVLKDEPSIHDLLSDEEQDGEKLAVDAKKIKKLRQKVKKIEQDIEKNKSYQRLQEWIKSDTGDLTGQEKLHVHGFEFKFKKEMSHFKKIGLIHEKIKKLRGGNEILSKRLTEAQRELKATLSSTQQAIKENPLETISPVWPAFSASSKDDAKNKKEQGNKEEADFFVLPSKKKVGIGKTAKGNDFLRNQWASDADLWFHLDGHKSSHAIVKAQIQELTEKDIALIGSLIADYSTFSSSSIPLMFTQVKFLKGTKGVAGLVRYTKEKYLTAHYQMDWKKQLI